MKMRQLIVLVFLFAVLGAKKPLGKAAQNLQQVLGQLAEARTQLRAAKRDERANTQALSDVDALMFRARRSLKKIEADLALQEKTVGHLRGQVHVDQAAVDKLKNRLRKRLRSLSMLGTLGPWRVLLAAKSLDQLALRRVLIKKVTIYDAELLGTLRQGRVRLSDDQQALLNALEALRQQRDASQATLKELELSRVARADAIQHFGKKRSSLELQIEALRQSEKKLRHLIWRHSPHKKNQEGLAKLRGQLPWPAPGRVEANNGGWNLRAAKGLPVRAIAAGRVVHAGFLRAYGGLVIIDHGHGFHSLYAHLDNISVKTNQTIKRATRLGSLGDSESLDGPKLYFELRRGGRPVNLKYWLSKQARLPVAE